MDPDRRVTQVVHLVFAKMTELGEFASGVALVPSPEKVCLPATVEGPGHHVTWNFPVYNTIWHMVQNPMYAGAYVFGKTESRTKVVDGRARKTLDTGSRRNPGQY